jgi:hypothetical protein
MSVSRRAFVIRGLVTVFFEKRGCRLVGRAAEKIEQLMPIVIETEKTADRRNFSFNSRAEFMTDQGDGA